MQVGRKVTDDYIVAALVGAEIDSPRFGATYRRLLAQAGVLRTVVDNPNMRIPRDNNVRRQLLRLVRGYPTTLLFDGFPTDVSWYRATVTPDELRAFYYADHPTWTTLSRGSRLVADGAANVYDVPTDENANQNIPAVADRVLAGERFPELLCVSTAHDGPVVIFEGHTRATAYVLAGDSCPDPVLLLVGFSTSMAAWRFFGNLPDRADPDLPRVPRA